MQLYLAEQQIRSVNTVAFASCVRAQSVDTYAPQNFQGRSDGCLGALRLVSQH